MNKIEIIDQFGNIRAQCTGEDIHLVWSGAYEPGDVIRVIPLAIRELLNKPGSFSF